MLSSAWNELAPSTLAALRDIDVRRRAMIGLAAANTIDASADLHVPGDRKLILTVHYYSPFRFTHWGAWWETGAGAWSGTTWGDDGRPPGP